MLGNDLDEQGGVHWILPVCVSVCLCLSCAQSFLPVIDVLWFCPRQVREILGQCSCPAQFPMIKVSEGKYKVGDSSALIFIRVRGPSAQHHKHRNLWMSFSTHLQDTSDQPLCFYSLRMISMILETTEEKAFDYSHLWSR